MIYPWLSRQGSSSRFEANETVIDCFSFKQAMQTMNRQVGLLLFPIIYFRTTGVIVPESFAKRACAGFAQLGKLFPHWCASELTHLSNKVLEASLWHSVVETEALAMGIPILQLKSASPTMEPIGLNSSLYSQLLAPSAWLQSLIYCFFTLPASITSVGGTINIPEVAVNFSGGNVHPIPFNTLLDPANWPFNAC